MCLRYCSPCRCDTKTKDNVFVRIVVSVQYQVIVRSQYLLSVPAISIVQVLHLAWSCSEGFIFILESAKCNCVL